MKDMDYAHAELRIVAYEGQHIIKLIARLLPASRRWMECKGYITQDNDGIQLTAAGYEYFIKMWRP